MKLSVQSDSQSTRGYVLLIVMVMLAISLIMVTGLFGYSSGNAKLNQRNNEYYNALAASEAATEKVLTYITSDFRDYGDGYVQLRLDTYRKLKPTTTEAAEWGDFDFMNLSGQKDRTEVRYTQLAGFQPMGGQYGQLKAFKDRVRILSNAQSQTSIDGVVGSVYQDVEFSRIPIFQYAVFYNVIMEYTPQPPMVITGPVHCNTNIYMNPSGALTFNSDVTSSGSIINGANPAGPFGSLGGPVVYKGAHDSGLSTLSLPIGTNNSPAAVQQVLEVPPFFENPLSSMGQQRYYNEADMIILVSNTTVTAKSGLWNNFATPVPTNQLLTFVSITNQFTNKREVKTIKAIDIDISGLVKWNATNGVLRPLLALNDIRTIYVADFRTVAVGTESGVRLINGTNLPPQGLTVATASPLYVQGDYNVTAAGRGTTNTIGTMPASFAADAITVLSTAWRDTNSAKSLSSRVAGDTTVNAAFLTGIVATTLASDSGGVENFPRFLEEWTGRTLTYNGSMVGMFYSKIATGLWLGIGSTYDIYNPPIRNWALDQNFSTYSKIPPATPSLAILGRAAWRTPAAYSTNVMAGF